MALPLVSVVTPVYNGEEHLRECVESVLRQTYENWELVIVDNCSTDGTGEIAAEYATADDRIRHERHEVHVDVNESYDRAVAAVNRESTYWKVIGADDWIYPECLSAMVELAEAHPGVGVVSAFRLEGSSVDFYGIPDEQTVMPGPEALAGHLRGQISAVGSPTAVLLRTDLLPANQPFYDPEFRHNDTEAVYRLLMHTEFGFVHDVLTFTRRPAAGSETSYTHRVNTLMPEFLRLHMRYGPSVLTSQEYRSGLRWWLRQYLWWHAKQRLRPSRRNDMEFHDFHRRQVRLIAAEAPDDREVQWSMRFIGSLLRDDV